MKDILESFTINGMMTACIDCIHRKHKMQRLSLATCVHENPNAIFEPKEEGFPENYHYGNLISCDGHERRDGIKDRRKNEQ